MLSTLSNHGGENWNDLQSTYRYMNNYVAPYPVKILFIFSVDKYETLQSIDDFLMTLASFYFTGMNRNEYIILESFFFTSIFFICSQYFERELLNFDIFIFIIEKTSLSKRHSDLSSRASCDKSLRRQANHRTGHVSGNTFVERNIQKFDASWKPHRMRMDPLRSFYGPFATVFPGTSLF